MRLWMNSVRFAVDGLRFAIRHERNMRIHLVIASLATALALLLDISGVEVLFVMVALVLVIATELVNTALEKTLDLIKPDEHPLAKAAKDCAAAAVLLCALFALIVAVVVFGPHLWEGPDWRWK